MEPSTSEWMTTAELAGKCRTQESTVRYWRHAGIGPKGTRIGKRVLYRAVDVEAWIAAREQAEHGTAESA